MRSPASGSGSRPALSHRPGRGVRIGAAAAVLAVTAVASAVVNLIVYAAAKALDVSLVVRAEGAAPHPVHAADVVSAAALPLLAGTVLAVAVAWWWAPVLRIAQVVGGALGVLSGLGPLLSLSDGGTKTTLFVMHALVGLAVVLGLEGVRRRALNPPVGS